MKFRISLSISTENRPTSILDWNYIESVYQFGENSHPNNIELYKHENYILKYKITFEDRKNIGFSIQKKDRD